MSAAVIAGVVLGATAAMPPATKWAHEEFTNYTARLFGAAPKVAFVLPDAAVWGTPPCRLEAACAARPPYRPEDFADDFAALKDTDGYAVRRRDDTIVFIADCPRGHVNGVHRWLEKNSDIIWPRPAKDLCFYTPFGGVRGAPALPITDHQPPPTNHQLPTTNYPLSSILYHLSSSSCDYRDIPAFRLRFFGGGAPDDETRRYLARNAVSPTASVSSPSANGEGRRYGTVGAFCDVFGGGHDMESRWFPRKEFFKDHPEYWMEIDGQRWTGKDSNFCETNPEFVKAYCGSVLAKIANLLPSVKIVSINMEDTRKTCTCKNCMKPIALPDGSTLMPDDPAFPSTRFFIFFNEVARAVAKARPDLKILQFAYLHLAVPPKVPVERNVILKFCPYPRNMRESVMFGPSNVAWRQRVEGWLANTPELYWREYYFCQCIQYPRPMADTAAEDLREIARRGVKYVYTDSPSRNGDGNRIIKMYALFRPAREFFDMCGVEAWTIEKLFWDPSLDPETLRADFIRRTFGPAAPHVAEFYRLLRDSWYTEKERSNFNDAPARCAAQFIVAKGLSEKCRAALAAAEKAADLPARRDWIAAMQAMLERWIAESPNYISRKIDVPEVPHATAPGLDTSAAPWTQAVCLPSFRLVRSPHTFDKSGTRAWIYSDGTAFHVAFDVRKVGPVRQRPPARPGAYPDGDRAEVSFGRDGTYWQFAFGADGSRFEAKERDAQWTCDWSVRTEKTSGGWRAVVRIPFAALGFDPSRDASIRFLAMVSPTYGESGRQVSSWSLGNGLPHSPLSWTTLQVLFH